MPSEKAMRSSLRKQVQNRSVRSATRTYVTTALKAIGGKDANQGEAAVKRAIQALDKAAKRGIIHGNNAARRKSRLMKRLNSLTSEK